MINISQAVQDIFQRDDVALAAARRGWLNLSGYAQAIKPQGQEASIVTALSRLMSGLPQPSGELAEKIQSLAVRSNLEGMTYEQSEHVSTKIREMYHQINPDNKSFLTITQGINEVTIIAETTVA